MVPSKRRYVRCVSGLQGAKMRAKGGSRALCRNRSLPNRKPNLTGFLSTNPGGERYPMSITSTSGRVFIHFQDLLAAPRKRGARAYHASLCPFSTSDHYTSVVLEIIHVPAVEQSVCLGGRRDRGVRAGR